MIDLYDLSKSAEKLMVGAWIYLAGLEFLWMFSVSSEPKCIWFMGLCPRNWTQQEYDFHVNRRFVCHA